MHWKLLRDSVSVRTSLEGALVRKKLKPYDVGNRLCIKVNKNELCKMFKTQDMKSGEWQSLHSYFF